MSETIRKASIVTFCSHFHLYIHVYALLLLSRGLSLVQISGIESAVIAVVFFMEVPTGVLADRVGRQWSISGSLFCLACAEFLFLFSRSYPAYIFIAFLTGTGFAFISGALESLVYDSLPQENRASLMKETMGKIGSVKQTAVFLSPLIGGFLVSDMTQRQFNLAISLTVVTLLVGLIVSLTLKEPESDWQVGRTRWLVILKDGLGELRGSSRLRRLIFIVILTTPFTGMLVTTLVPPFLRRWEITPFLIGLAMSIGNLLAAFTQRWAHRLEQILGLRWGLTILTLLPGLGYLLLAAVDQPILAWLLVVWMYGSNDMRSPLVSAYQNEMISSRSRATMLSLINMFLNLFIAVMMPIYALLAGLSIQITFLVMGCVILVSASLLRVDRFHAISAS